MTTGPALLRDLNAADWAAFEPLWAGYLVFYQTELPAEISQLAFERLADPGRTDMGCLVAELDGAMVGFATYVLHPSTWSKGPYCYLEDLFTAPAARRRGVGRQLIEAVAARAQALGAPKLYWQTQETNTTGRALYDQLASYHGFIVYQRRFESPV